MSDSIKHECGIALIRLLKPLSFYQEKYGTSLYGLDKLYLLMEKQHNRGQDGAGIATIKLDVKPGHRYISRYRALGKSAISEIFAHVQGKFAAVQKANPENFSDSVWLKENMSFTGEVLMGHLRYSTQSNNSLENCHPFLRQNNWKTRNLVISGNFNMTNVDELLEQLFELGQHPKEQVDTVTVLEKIGHFLDTENNVLFDQFKKQGYTNVEISELIAQNLDVAKILRRSAKTWDGGYAINGIFGHGDAFVMRDPAGIRPAFYYQDDEVVVVTSERPAIQTAFNIPIEQIKEIDPGHALIIKKNGAVSLEQFIEPIAKRACSFERIYFSRGSDASIYQERKKLGQLLCDSVLKSINYDIKNTVFAFIPNTAEIAYHGLHDGVNKYVRELQGLTLLDRSDKISNEEMSKMLNIVPRFEKLVIKDAKLRTFITQDADRQDMVAHVYDTTYGIVNPNVDTIVAIDDSIVRGTTLKQSVLKILDRLKPKKIIIVSSAPQIRYPDCYGIDMSRMGEFVAFNAAISLLRKRGMGHVIDEVYEKCVASQELDKEKAINHVKEIYAPFTYDEISTEIARIITPSDINAEVDVIYQTLDNLHVACPDHLGDWYFSGDYPTPGGVKVVNKAFTNWVEGKTSRAYFSV